MTGRGSIEAYMAELSRLLGWRRFFERRGLRELRDHLECSARANRRDGMTGADAEAAAIDALGTLDHSLCVILESNRALTLLGIARDRRLLLACLLIAPGVALLGLSFLTFNFPCPASPPCGVPSLQFLRPWLADFGLYGMPLWYQATQFAVTTLGPLAAAIVLLADQTRIRFDRDGGPAGLVLVRPATHRAVALVAAAVVFAAVAAYKLAG